MSLYLFQVSYNAAGTKTMVDHPHSREDAARRTIEALGGRLHGFYFAFGDFDAVLIVEMPDNVTAAAASMAVGATGAFSKFHTTVLMTAADGVAAMKKAKSVSFAPPQ
jgi:uncharacterized protein with GYD domain